MLSFGHDELVPHFIYCRRYFFTSRAVENFRRMFLTNMKRYGIQSSMVTMLHMWRKNLITKEKAKEASEGKLKNEKNWKYQEVSINDDLEMFLTNILNSKEIKEEKVYSFFTPKLTKEELKLVEVKNKEHLKTYGYHYDGVDPDVDPEEMKKSDSKSKYVHGTCVRRTFSLTVEK